MRKDGFAEGGRLLGGKEQNLTGDHYAWNQIG